MAGRDGLPEAGAVDCCPGSDSVDKDTDSAQQRIAKIALINSTCAIFNLGSIIRSNPDRKGPIHEQA